MTAQGEKRHAAEKNPCNSKAGYNRSGQEGTTRSMLWPYHKYLLCTEFSVPQPELKTALGTVSPSYPLGINSRSPSRDQRPSCSNPLPKRSSMNTVGPQYPQVSHPQIQPTLDLTALSCIRRCETSEGRL